MLRGLCSHELKPEFRPVSGMQTVRSCIAQARSQTVPNADSTPPHGPRNDRPANGSEVDPEIDRVDRSSRSSVFEVESADSVL